MPWCCRAAGRVVLAGCLGAASCGDAGGGGSVVEAPALVSGSADGVKYGAPSAGPPFAPRIATVLTGSAPTGTPEAPPKRLLTPSQGSGAWRWSGEGLERSLRIRSTAASSDDPAPLKALGVVASENLASSGTANIGIELPIACFMALPEADTYALRTIIAERLRAELAAVQLSSVEVTAPSVLQVSPATSSNGSVHVDVGPRIIFQATVRYNNASASAIKSSLSSSYIGANMVVVAEEKLPRFRSACDNGPRTLNVVLRGLLLGDLMPAHRGDFVRVDDGSVALGARLPPWLPVVLVGSGGAVWVVAALYFGKSLLQNCPARQYKAQLHPDSHVDPDCHDFVAIVVPGGGLMPSGDAAPWTEARLLEAGALYEEMQIARAIGKSQLGAPRIITHSAWNPVAPNRSDYFSSSRTCEADVCACYLHERCGVPPQAVWPDSLSFTLVGNAYWCRTRYVEAYEVRHVVVVTNCFQMRRVKAVFAKIFSLPPLPHGREDWCALSFREAADAGLDPEGLAALREQERVALRNFESLQDRFTSLHAVERFLADVFSDAGTLQIASATRR